MEDIIAIEYDVTPTIANMLAMAQELQETRQRAEAAESALRLASKAPNKGSTAVTVLLDVWAEHYTSIDRYGADQWRRGNAGQEPQEFDEWQRDVGA